MRRWLPVFVLLVIIYCLSSIPSLHLMNEQLLPVWLMGYLNQYTFRIGQDGFFSYMFSLHPDFVLHKLSHVVAFGTLGVALYFATKKSFYWTIFLTAVAAGCDEFHQYFVPGRSSRLGDVILDTLSAIIFVMLWRKFKNGIAP
ncbi:VanZ family protein [Sporomusaceae bacterium BoRhaA]|uniref:VanZ family protein n=1 Tax=Pelorhabdus rhamnosifermentans TaxID=2772457 RepID=UPI001C05F0F7|nr:VanZ family protein [Pelorhabdus rhamnosifermentans]MBU2699080.1 VanZ family protein [Pelorhabdus rhamnosifermentans]